MTRSRYFGARIFGYSLTALAITVLMMTVLGFTWVAQLRHLLWYEMMKGHPAVPALLWGGVLAITVVVFVIWYRIFAAMLRYQRQQGLLTRHMNPLLGPLPTELNPDLSRIADFYMADDEVSYYAFTWGIRRPQIAISRALWNSLDGPGRHAVLYHEAAHVMARDPLQQAILQVLARALPPFGMDALYERYLLRREVFADSLAISACGGDDEPLISALLVVAQSTHEMEAGVGIEGGLQARMEFLKTGEIPGFWDQQMRYRLEATGSAVLLTLAEGLLVWCH